MTERFVTRILLVLLSWFLAVPLSAQSPAPSATADKPAVPENADKPANHAQITPGPLDGRIAAVAASLLQQWHYSKQEFNGSVSSKFLDRYLEALDPQHLHFTQPDLAQFESYRTNLGEMTLTSADTHPACEIFNRFMQRLQQRAAYVDQLLKQETFTFDSDERITVNRHELPYPKDLDEAKRLWRERLRFEYLQEKLGKLGEKKKVEAAAAKNDAPLAPAKAPPQPSEPA